jgi:hypothetical protein
MAGSGGFLPDERSGILLPLYASRRTEIPAARYRNIEGQHGLGEPLKLSVPTSKACRQHHSSSFTVAAMLGGGSDLDGIPSRSSNTSVSVVMPFAITDAIGRK